MKAKGEVTLFNSMPDGKAEELNAGAIIIRDGRIQIAATGEIRLESGSALVVSAGNVSGEYAGIRNRPEDGEFALFFGAEDSDGSGAQFSLSHQGSVNMKDARVSGTLEVIHDAGGEADKDVIFCDGSTFGIAESAADNLLSALGEGKIKSFLGLYGGASYVGALPPAEAVLNPKYGDRYLYLSSSVGYPAYLYSPSLYGWRVSRSWKQKKIRTRVTYSYVSGDRSAQPLQSSEDGEWQNSGEISVGTPERENGVFCYAEAAEYGEEAAPSCISTDLSTVTVNGWTGKKYIKKYAIFRSAESAVHYAVSGIIPAESGGTLDAQRQIASALLSVQPSAAGGEYSAYVSQTDDGQSGRRLVSAGEADGAVYSFPLFAGLSELSLGGRRLVIEPQGTGNTAVQLVSASVSVAYGGSASVHQEYAYDGSAWQAL